MDKIIILGFGTMGKQIASLMCLLKYEVIIWNRNIGENFEKDFLKSRKMLARQLGYELEENKVCFEKEIDSLPTGIYIETVVENLKIKKEIYKKLKCKATLYFSNTSSFSTADISDNVNALHFFNPISMKILEYTKSNKSQSFITKLIKQLENINFNCIEVNDNRGYIGNYILFTEISNIFKLIEKYNYSYLDIRKMYSTLYDSRDIFKIIDLVGIDVSYQIIKNLNQSDLSIYIPKSLEYALDNNILGKKNKTSILQVFNVQETT